MTAMQDRKPDERGPFSFEPGMLYVRSLGRGDYIYEESLHYEKEWQKWRMQDLAKLQGGTLTLNLECPYEGSRTRVGRTLSGNTIIHRRATDADLDRFMAGSLFRYCPTKPHDWVDVVSGLNDLKDTEKARIKAAYNRRFLDTAQQ